jgi:hypothetical protein
MEDRKMIEMKFVQSDFITRWPCHVCGGCTEKVEILVEGVDESDNEIRICETCLKEREQIDVKLEKHAEYLLDQAAWLRSLIGRINAPSHAEWKAAMEAYNAVAEAAYDEPVTRDQLPLTEVTVSGFGTDKAPSESQIEKGLHGFLKKMAMNAPKVT